MGNPPQQRSDTGREAADQKARTFAPEPRKTTRVRFVTSVTAASPAFIFVANVWRLPQSNQLIAASERVGLSVTLEVRPETD